jgi:aldose sugar dehydrogenase
LIVGIAAACAPVAPPPAPSGGPTAVPREQPAARPRDGQQPLQPIAESVLDGLKLPAALQFAPDGRLFFVEVNAGRIRVADGRRLQAEPFATLPVQQAAESGLLGLALDPDFGRNRWVYAFYSEGDPEVPKRGVRNRLVRFTDRDGIGVEMTPILGDLPANPKGGVLAHQGGAIAFGPDGKLYLSIGDTNKEKGRVAQDPARLQGKILRVNPDGSVPADNPFAGSPVFALGFRNSWGLTFQPGTGTLFATENGNLSHDEINLVRAGSNHGWPHVEGMSGDPRFADPLWDSGSGKKSRRGMVGLTFYAGALFPELRDELLFCTFNDGVLHRAALEPPGYDRIGAISGLADDCRLGLTVGPDGAIYYSSVTQIRRLVPSAASLNR